MLLIKVDLIIEEQNCKKDVFRFCDTSYIEIILALSIKVVALYICVSIVQTEVLSLKDFFLESGICLKLAMFLPSNK